jgi:macrolide transport system ATP-binding/permease protein
MQVLRLNSISFRYESQTQLLFSNISHTFDFGWTGITGANGVGKSTLLAISCGRLQQESGTVTGPENRIYCEQSTDSPPENFTDFLYAYDNESERLKARLSIDDDWPYRWETLSHGERKRAQIAAALWAEPEVLALDEPTNHIDMESKNLLYEMLKAYKGIGILISHDRSLFNILCSGILFMDSQRVVGRTRVWN